MLGAVTAFGYTIPMVVILVLVALVVGLGLAVLFWLTVGLSVYRSVQRTRRKRVREELRDELVEILFDPGADWTGWVEGLSSLERDVVETLLDEYLRELDGENVEKLQELGEQLGIPDRSRRRLGARREYDRLYALTWLALLDRPDELRAAGFSPRTTRERASVARLRHESGDLDDPEEGIAILLEGTSSQFSVFGQDTLYRVAAEDPGALFAVAVDNYRTWPESLLVQVLVVCQHLGTSVTTEDLSWLTATLQHERDAVREAATLALGNVGWRRDVRDDPLLDQLVDDPAPRVRSAAYRSLARWGDQQALDTLAASLQTEANAWPRLAGTNALVRQREQPPDDSPPDLETAWAWSSEHLDFDTVARRQGPGASD